MVKKNAKQLIEQSLMTLLEENLIDRVEIQDISKLSNLSRQTFYYNFKNKQDLLFWVLEQDSTLAIDAFRSSGSIRDYVLTALTTIQKKSIFYRRLEQSDGRYRSYITYFENGLINCAQIIENRSVLGRMNASLWDTVHFFAYGASGMVQNWIEKGMQLTPEQLTDVIIRNIPTSMERYIRSTNERQ